MIRGRNDVGRIRLTAGAVLNKFLLLFIVEQFVIVVFGDCLEIDGLPGIGSVVSHDETGIKPTSFSLPCSSQ